MKTAVFPGSFDPFTIGHADIVKRALSIFDTIYIAIGNNSAKQPLFTPAERLRRIEWYFSGEPDIIVELYEGLTVDYCRKVDAGHIIRGLRSVADFEYEISIAQVNRTMYPHPETIFLVTDPAHAHISSTIIRDIIRNGGDASGMMI